MLKREESAEKYPELQNKYGTREFLCRGEGIKWIQQEEYEKIWGVYTVLVGGGRGENRLTMEIF